MPDARCQIEDRNPKSKIENGSKGMPAMRTPLTASESRRHLRSGFTLVELMTSIGIIIFILSVTMVAFGPLMKSSGLKTASRTVRTVMEGARIRAIQQHRRVRFEAQLVVGTEFSTRQWTVTPNAGDPLHEWTRLPEFVSINTDGAGNPIAADLNDAAEGIKAVGVTFGPDGSVVRVLVTDKSGATTTDDSPSQMFRIRLANLRETAKADMFRYIHITPLTGGSVTVDEAGEVY